MGVVLTVTTCLWNSNQYSRHFSRCYDESWAEKLYRGFKANLTVPFEFVCFTDRKRKFAEPIEQERIKTTPPSYAACIEPFRLDTPQIFCGLDTIVVGNCDALAEYCLTADKPAIPRDPFEGASPWKRTNAVVLAPRGCKATLYDEWRGENDMNWINTRDTNLLDDLFPGAVRSYKGHVQYVGIDDATRIVFFHGPHKCHELGHVGWIAKHWHDNARQAA